MKCLSVSFGPSTLFCNEGWFGSPPSASATTACSTRSSSFTRASRIRRNQLCQQRETSPLKSPLLANLRRFGAPSVREIFSMALILGSNSFFHILYKELFDRIFERLYSPFIRSPYPCLASCNLPIFCNPRRGAENEAIDRTVLSDQSRRK